MMIIPSVGRGVNKREMSYIAGRNVKSYRFSGGSSV